MSSSTHFSPADDNLYDHEVKTMANFKGTLGILTGGGDVPGLNPAIRAVTYRALREGYRVLGIRRGWGGLVDVIPIKRQTTPPRYKS